MDPLVRYAIVFAMYLPAIIMFGFARRALAARRPEVWARIRPLGQLGARMKMFFGDDHIALGDPVVSRKIWQARWAVVGSLMLVVAAAGATSPRCVAMWA